MKQVSDVTVFFESCVTVLLISTLAWKGTESVRIKDLRVPDIVRNGTGTPVVLDCDYSLEDSKPKDGLVVKWFFNNHPSPVYQWIPDQKPQDLGVLKGKLNLNYRASDDATKMHRALEIVNPTTELSGEYLCLVSTFSGEDSQSKKMVIYVPEKNLALKQTKPKEDTVTITCTADGVFPEPTMTIISSDSTHKGRPEVNTTSRDGLFDIVATVTIEDRDLDSPTTFDCELRIPEANYTVKRSSVYYPDSATSMKLSFWLLGFAICLSCL